MDLYDFRTQELPAREILARRIRLLRTLHGWSQEMLAELALLHRTHIGVLERGEGNPCLNSIEKIARAFEVPLRTLLDERFENLFDQKINRVEELRLAYGNGVPLHHYWLSSATAPCAGHGCPSATDRKS